MFGGMAGNNLGFGQQQAAVGLGGGFNQQLQQGTGNPPFNPTKVWHYYSKNGFKKISVARAFIII